MMSLASGPIRQWGLLEYQLEAPIAIEVKGHLPSARCQLTQQALFDKDDNVAYFTPPVGLGIVGGPHPTGWAVKEGSSSLADQPPGDVEHPSPLSDQGLDPRGRQEGFH
jgi:hypothetical protein